MDPNLQFVWQVCVGTPSVRTSLKPWDPVPEDVTMSRHCADPTRLRLSIQKRCPHEPRGDSMSGPVESGHRTVGLGKAARVSRLVGSSCLHLVSFVSRLRSLSKTWNTGRDCGQALPSGLADVPRSWLALPNDDVQIEDPLLGIRLVWCV